MHASGDRYLRDELDGRGERIRTSGLYVPNVALYRAKLHPDWYGYLKQRAEGGKTDGRGERIRTSGLYVPNVALYRAKLHPDWV